MSSDMEKDNCPICLNSLTDSEFQTTQCGHSFHKNCFDQLKKKGFDTCPMCRASLTLAKVRKNDNAVVNQIRDVSEEEREEERRLINLALAIINRDNTVSDSKLAGMLHAAKGRQDFTIDDVLSMFDDDRPAARIRDVSPVASSAASGNVSRAASRTSRTVTKRDPKRVADILKKWKKLNPEKSGGKTKKKGQRTHRRKKNTSQSL